MYKTEEIEKQCTAAGEGWTCARPVRSKGLCRSHYAHNLQHPGKTLQKLRRKIPYPKDGKCTFQDCDKSVLTHSLCAGHYEQSKTGEVRPLYLDRKPHGHWQEALNEAVLEPWPEACIIWQGSRNNNGYGQVSVGGVPGLAHRWAYALTKNGGVYPKGAEIRHVCGNGRGGCVNPRHLTSGTHTENMQDMRAETLKEYARLLEKEKEESVVLSIPDRRSGSCAVRDCSRASISRSVSGTTAFCKLHYERNQLGIPLSLPIRDKAPHGTDEKWLLSIQSLVTDECILYPGKVGSHGYGQTYYEGASRLVHRVVYIQNFGEPPVETPIINHICNNTRCCNIRHLEAVSAKGNMQWMAVQGRSRAQRTKRERLNKKTNDLQLSSSAALPPEPDRIHSSGQPGASVSD